VKITERHSESVIITQFYQAEMFKRVLSTAACYTN